jgi:hypothetical protein
MAAKLISPTDPIEVKQICCLVYGQPGSRKTSLAQTALEPVTLAFDPGLYRAYGRKWGAVFDSWADVLGFDLAGYKTVVVDTIGMCLEKLAVQVAGQDPKNRKRDGGLSLSGYGDLKTAFAAWVNALKQRGQDVLFVAHEKSEPIGGEPYYFPDIVGGSYNTTMYHADIVGYMHFDAGQRVIDWSPTDRWMAKTPPCGWGRMEIPDFSKEPAFMTGLLAQAKASMGQVSAQSAQVATEATRWAEAIEACQSPDDMNKCLPDAGQMKGAVKKQVWALMQGRAEKMGWEFDKAAKLFKAKEVAVA